MNTAASRIQQAAAGSYFAPVCLAVLLHMAVFWVFAGGLEALWPQSKPKPVVQKIVKASLVSIKPKPAPRPKVQPKPKPKPAEKAKPKPKPKVEPKPVVEQPKPEPEIAPRSEESLLDDLLADEDMALEQEEELTEVARYSAAMRQMIEQNWSRPPSARNNMQALLKIQLIPTGDVISVSVKRGSGNAAFDRAAVLAVEKVGRFDFFKDIPSAMFENYFRNVELTFRPEDLRL